MNGVEHRFCIIAGRIKVIVFVHVLKLSHRTEAVRLFLDRLVNLLQELQFAPRILIQHRTTVMTLRRRKSIRRFGREKVQSGGELQNLPLQ